MYKYTSLMHAMFDILYYSNSLCLEITSNLSPNGNMLGQIVSLNIHSSQKKQQQSDLVENVRMG